MEIIQINGVFFKVSEATLDEIDLLVATLYDTCCEPFLTDLNNLLGRIYFNNPKTDHVQGLVNYEYFF
jgi:hypothetical protein